MGSYFSSNEIVPDFISNAESIPSKLFPLKVHKSDTRHDVIRFIIISDTHTRHRDLSLPLGDVLIHCGDWSNHPTSKQDYIDFDIWLGEQPHKHKIIVAGNHEIGLPHNPREVQELFANAVCLFDQTYEVEGVKLYGAPGIPARSFLYRANYMQYSRPIEKWNGIPYGTDILITHTPPRFVMDYGKHSRGYWREGDMELLNRAMNVKPKVHCFGHNHDQPGVMRVSHSLDTLKCAEDSTLFINASMFRGIIPPVVVDFHM
ncbi:Ser/Thr phosphatase family superfamily protein [Oopsacas minuta]|uniref:Ser/Thr phosphatase family superfamily protein n=1 Tax=Oopsacas minuta TaxID=111878 RepID=A0AAV7K4T4_9METZ|nr:Ser/Thr phosphatase family superfamily protein [Oopsacas minuta]